MTSNLRSTLDEDDYESFIASVDRKGLSWAHSQFSRMLGGEAADRARARYEREMALVATLCLNQSIQVPHVRWYGGPQPNDRYWPPLKRLLLRKRSEAEVIPLDEESTKVVDLIEAPTSESFPSRGLVMGFVQSGKTGNFTAVTAKAADRGYRLIIVLSGVTDSLRNQTQGRLNRELVSLNPEFWTPLTSIDKDFVPPASATNYLSMHHNQKILCVVKKNASRLRALTTWLKSADRSVLEKCPALIIDDEADQASVATKTINPLVRGLIATLPKAVYVGYTATPFANLLIDPSANDLYPTQFIYAMRKPLGHFGTETIFGRVDTEYDGGDGDVPLDGYDMVRIVPDDDVPALKPKRTEIVAGLNIEPPASLVEAVRYFLLATACRRMRATGNPNSTMLVHTSVNTRVHQAFVKPLQDLLVEHHAGLKDRDAEVEEAFRSTWEGEVDRVPASLFGRERVTFEELRPCLVGVSGECNVVMDNYRSDDRLVYPENETDPPVLAIVVGGNTLSRGLTLEGLVSSYFVRGASAYDTLLQMGRWFGYREGFEDLPRIWMTDELRGWFRHLALVESEVRIDIERYFRENLTPETFAVRIRQHPKLAITAASRMGSATTAFASYGGRRVQPRYFKRKDKAWLSGNRLAAEALIDAITGLGGTFEPRADRVEIRLAGGVDVEHVLRFVSSYQFHGDEFDKDSRLLTKYIKGQLERGSLAKWVVAIVGNRDEEQTATLTLAGRETRSLRRSRLKEVIDDPERADIKTLMSKEHYVLDLPAMTMAEARREGEARLADRKRGLKTGLLVLYPIDRRSVPDEVNRPTRADLDAAAETIAAAFVFPGTGDEDGVKYVSADLARLKMTPADVEVEEEGILEEAWAQ